MKLARLHGIIALGFVVLVIGFFVTQSRPSTPSASTPAVHVEAPTSAGADLARSENTLAQRRPADTAVELTAPRKESPEDWIVLVLDNSTKEPVAGAEVAWTSKRVMVRDSSRPLVDFDPESFLDADAQWVGTDEHGRVRLAPDALPGLVCARRGKAFGSTSVNERREATIQVRLQHASHVDIQVVDAAGQPVSGVPVSLRAADAVQGAQPIWTGITAGDAGIARARHFGSRLGRLKRPFELVAGFEFPTRTAATVPVDIEHPSAEPIRLALPPSGSVEVRVHDSDRQPVLPSSIQLNVTVAGEADFITTPNLSQFQPAIVEKGRALFPFVETGLDLTVQVSANMTMPHTSGPGPRVNGERVMFELDAGVPKPLIVGRLVDESGHPLRDADVQYGHEFKTPLAGHWSFPIRTSTEGRFEVTSLAESEVPIRAVLSFRPFGRVATAGGAGSVKLEAPLHAGENDIGDVVVRMPIVLATGRVVDEQDAPVPDPLLTVEIEITGQGLESWSRDTDTTARVGDAGTFKVVSTSTHPRLRIHVQRSGYVQLEPAQVPSGARDVKITLLKASEISGSVIVDPDTTLSEITVFVRPLTEPEPTWQMALHNERTHLRADGTFRLVDVGPLAVDLLVRRPGMREPLVVVPNLDLRGGGAAKDPRLVGIDLRGRLVPARDSRKVDAAPR